ncbi:hypothetical protein BcabD6B2_58890 (apicoplast) [Babesia caballi]|uniref:Uncharacterized protein n=1 Tax=Babesia caballi TaxID=5871 RepID=A0AAV4M2Y6_BABCB|nr:hypothetical protein BcabD6B2_58890 [Babesia caballi]
MYINKKLKYINRYKYNNKRPFYIKTYIPFKKNINDECTKPSSKLKFKNCKLIN